MKKLISLLLVISMMLSLCACGKKSAESVEIVAAPENSKAEFVALSSNMKLVKTFGTTHVTDDTNDEQAIISDMNLYSGYGVGTEVNSHAWINLDNAKLLKMDEQSNIAIEADGRKLKVALAEGSVFFCVLEALEKDEELIFETPNATNMAMAVRGTTGIIKVVSDTESQVVLLEGSVSLENKSGNSLYIKAGEVGIFSVAEDGTVSETKRDLRDSDVPSYAMDMIQENEDVKNKILATDKGENYLQMAEQYSYYEEVIECYRAALAGHKPEMPSPYWEDLCEIYEYRESTNCSYWMTEHGFESENPEDLQHWTYGYRDINGDGYPELLVGDAWTKGNGRAYACWTTDGKQAKSATPKPDADHPFQQLAVTSDGYLKAYQCVYTSNYLDESKPGVEAHIYAIDPSGENSGLGECVYYIPNPNYFGDGAKVYDGNDQLIFSTDDRAEFEAYLKENHLEGWGTTYQMPLN